LVATGAVTLKNDVTVTGSVHAGYLHAAGPLVATGAVTLKNDVTVTGSVHAGYLHAAGPLVATGAVTLKNDVTVTGTVNAGYLHAAGGAIVSGDTTVTGSVHAGYLHAAGPLVATGAVTLKNDVTVTGTVNAGRLHAAGPLVVSGTTNINVNNNAASNIGTGTTSSTVTIGGSNNVVKFPGAPGHTTGQADAIALLIDSTGEIGTVSSSHRYKDKIQDLGDRSAALMQLRPVSFAYKSDASQRTQYGLIAEEVAEVLPEIVVYNKDNQPETVAYHILPSLLLNEAIRQDKRLSRVEEQNNDLGRINDRITAIREELTIVINAQQEQINYLSQQVQALQK
jgi:cytoskeletal protein CcmA (bactofilin family)